MVEFLTIFDKTYGLFQIVKCFYKIEEEEKIYGDFITRP